MNHLLANHFHASEAFCLALGACHRSLSPETVTKLEASQARYRLAAQRLEGAAMELHPLEQLGVQALLSAQVGASQGIVWHNRSKLNRQLAEVAALAGDSECSAKLEAEADELELKVEGLADPVFTAQALSDAVGEVMVMGEVRP